MPDYYQLFKIPSSSNPDQIQSAYHRERARLLASAADESSISSALQGLDDAFAVLSDPTQRAAYDRSRGESSLSALTVGTASASNALQAGTATPRPVQQRACPNCGTPNPIQATLCSYCGQQISRPCPKCGNPVALNEQVCLRCGTHITEYDQSRFAQSKALEEKIDRERQATDVRVAALEKTHGSNRKFGFLFWAVVLGLALGVCLLGGFLLAASGR